MNWKTVCLLVVLALATIIILFQNQHVITGSQWLLQTNFLDTQPQGQTPVQQTFTRADANASDEGNHNSETKGTGLRSHEQRLKSKQQNGGPVTLSETKLKRSGEMSVTKTKKGNPQINGDHQGRLKVAYVTLVDAPEVDANFYETSFKAHLYSLYKHGMVDWDDILILATPSAPPSIIPWLENMGIKVKMIQEFECNNNRALTRILSRARTWCLKEYDAVVYTDINTLVLRDIRNIVSLCLKNVELCGVAAIDELPHTFIDMGVFVAFPSLSVCKDVTKVRITATLGSQCEEQLVRSLFSTRTTSTIDSLYNTVLQNNLRRHSIQAARIVQYSLAKPFQSTNEKNKDEMLVFKKVYDQAYRAIDLLSFDRFSSTTPFNEGTVPSRVLYATILTPNGDKSNVDDRLGWQVLKRHFISKFVNGKIPWENMAIVYTGEPNEDYRNWILARGGHTIQVDPLYCINGKETRYKFQFTKLQLWNLTDWDYIVYMDLDTFVLDDISDMWSKCIDGAVVCGIPEPYRQPHQSYINGGVLVIPTNRDTYEDLTEMHKTYPPRLYCEQDFLNEVVPAQKKGLLDFRYNGMTFTGTREYSMKDVFIVHYKLQMIDNLVYKNTADEREFIHAKFGEIDEITDEIENKYRLH